MKNVDVTTVLLGLQDQHSKFVKEYLSVLEIPLSNADAREQYYILEDLGLIPGPSILILVLQGIPNSLQDDNARCRVSRATMQWYADNNIHRLDWLAQSPDLNPIQHLWDKLDCCIRTHQVRPKSIAQLMEWFGVKGRGKQEIPQKTCRPVALSSMFPTYENLGATPPGIKPSLPRWEVRSLNTTPPQPGGGGNNDDDVRSQEYGQMHHDGE
ncbi:hypothetical protein PR048_012876 [Dryococelus australis]|uniref:Uncharacterized protein n=1 Tax=Dryococelus australis TaxID=614101 RepID=A0ABQ9HQL0_9NEOP|nr:hypothetical protein PR048_012876 [Dryococelus australis]